MLNNTKIQSVVNETTRDIDIYVLLNDTTKIGIKDDLKNFIFDTKIDKDGMWVGSVIPKMLELEVINIENKYNFIKGDKIEVFYGFLVGAEYEYQKLGTFYSEESEVSEDKKSIKITAYDKLKSLQEIDANKHTYPITIEDMLLKYDINSSGLSYPIVLIEKEIFLGNNPKIVDVVRAAAQANLCYVVSNDGFIQFRLPLSRVDLEISRNNIFELRYKDKQEKYNTITISRQPQNDDVFASLPGITEKSEMKVSNNPILDLRREEWANWLVDILFNIPDYYGIERLVMQANPLIEAGDVISIDGKKTLVLHHRIEGTRSIIKSEIAKKSETDFNRAKGLEERIKNTELYVDKVKGEIVATISDSVDERLTELKLDDESITQKVTSTVDTYVTENKEMLKGPKGDTGPAGSDADVGPLRTELETYKAQTDAEIAARVKQTTYDSRQTVINNKFSEIIQNAENIKLSVKNINTYTNLIANADGFIDTPENLALGGGTTNVKKGYFGDFRERDGSMILAANQGAGTYVFRIPLRYAPAVDNYLLKVGSLYSSSGITNIRTHIRKEDSTAYSTFETLKANSLIQIKKGSNVTTTPDNLKWLQITYEVTTENTMEFIRLYANNIALVAVDNEKPVPTSLEWSSIRPASSSASIEIIANDLISEIKLTGDQITLDGNTKVLGSFKVASGNIAKIGGWNLSSNYLRSNDETVGIGVNHISSSASAFWAGYNKTNNSYAFRVTHGGELIANSATIKGSIEATSGKIGAWNISSAYLQSANERVGIGVNEYGDKASAFWAGYNGSTTKFYVRHDGYLKAEDANIAGHIEASSGKIGSWNITGQYLQSSNGSVGIGINNNGGAASAFWAGYNGSTTQFNVSHAGNVTARSLTITGGKVGGSTIYSNSLSGGSYSSGSFTSGSFSGSHYGSASLTSGSYTGSGYLSGGSTVAGHSLTSSSGSLRVSSFSAGTVSTGDFKLGGGRIYGSYNANIGATTSAALNYSGWSISNSDIRLKENITELDHRYDKYIYDLPLIKYNYIGKDKVSAGVNANYLAKTLPQDMVDSFINRDEVSGLYGVQYEMIVPYMIKTIQDLNSRLKRLENGEYS